MQSESLFSLYKFYNLSTIFPNLLYCNYAFKKCFSYLVMITLITKTSRYVLFFCFFLPSELRYYVKHRSYSINTHGSEDIVAVELDIGDNIDLNSKGAPRRQFSEKERCKET